LAGVEILEQADMPVEETGAVITRARVKIGSEPPRVVYLSPNTYAGEIPIIVGDFDEAKSLLDDPSLKIDYQYIRVTPRAYVRSEVSQSI
jgi:hypothetical protein